MKILVKRNEQQPKITIDLKDVHYVYAIRDALKLALELDGFTQDTISEVFNQKFYEVKCEGAETI